jgi:hypothetical protein
VVRKTTSTSALSIQHEDVIVLPIYRVQSIRVEERCAKEKLHSRRAALKTPSKGKSRTRAHLHYPPPPHQPVREWAETHTVGEAGDTQVEEMVKTTAALEAAAVGCSEDETRLKALTKELAAAEKTAAAARKAAEVRRTLIAMR